MCKLVVTSVCLLVAYHRQQSGTIPILCHIIFRPTLNIFTKIFHILQKKKKKMVANILATKFGIVPDWSGTRTYANDSMMR